MLLALHTTNHNAFQREEAGHWNMAIIHKQEITTAPQAAPQVSVGLAGSYTSKEPMASGVSYYQNLLKDGTFGFTETQHSLSYTVRALLVCLK